MSQKKHNNDETIMMEKLIEKGLKELCHVAISINDPILMEDFFRCLFTPAEIKDIAKRWLLVKEIDKGTTQRDIAKKFKISLCKITRGSKELKKENSAFRKMLNSV